jgi:hypothetical protein
MGASMTTFQILALGIMVALTPSLIVLAYFLWRAPVIERKREQVSRTPRPTSAGVPNRYVEVTTLQPQEHEQDNHRPQSDVRDHAGQESRFRGTT